MASGAGSPVVISALSVPELQHVEWRNDGLVVGAGVTIQTFMDSLNYAPENIPGTNSHYTSVLSLNTPLFIY